MVRALNKEAVHSLYSQASLIHAVNEASRHGHHQAQVEQKEEWLSHFKEAGQSTGRSSNKVWQDSYTVIMPSCRFL